MSQEVELESGESFSSDKNNRQERLNPPPKDKSTKRDSKPMVKRKSLLSEKQESKVDDFCQRVLLSRESINALLKDQKFDEY